MKKIFTLIAAFFVTLTVANAQSSLQVIEESTSTIYPTGSSVYQAAVPGQTVSLNFNFKNVSSSQKTYSVIRTKLSMNTGAVSYFCYGGTCFPPNVNTPGSSSYVTLAAGQDAVSAGAGYDLIVYLADGSTAGQSDVQYKIYNTADPTDTSTIIMHYNSPTSITSIAASDFSVSEIFPNPASSKAVINVNMAKEYNGVLNVYNALGAVVATKTLNLSIGKNSIPVDVESLNNGLYFATLTLGNNKVTKRFIVSNR